MSRLLKFVAVAVAALSVVALLPQPAWAVEGMGAFKGSFIFFPYWNNEGANRTYFRIAMDTEINDLTPQGTLQLHMFYLARNPLATSINQAVPACFEYDRYVTFTPDDWELLNTYSHNNQFAGGDGRLGWAFAYAVLQRLDATRMKVLWDRYFSDTFIVDTSLGTTVSWNNYQQWGNEWKALVPAPPGTVAVPPVLIFDNPVADGLCAYTRDIQNDEFTANPNNPPIVFPPPHPPVAPGAAISPNDICGIGSDDGTATLSSTGYVVDPGRVFPNVAVFGPPGEYVGDDFADTFYANYFTERRTLNGGTFSPTQFSITPVHVDDTVNPTNGFQGFPAPVPVLVPLAHSAFFNIGDDTNAQNYQFDLEVFDHNEVSYSAPPRFVICHGLRTIHQLTNNITMNLRQGHMTVWDVDGVFGSGMASEDAALLGIDTLNNITGNAAFDSAFASYPAHNRTTGPMSGFSALTGIQPPTVYDPDTTGGYGDP